jgi:hypothetical protein
VNIGSGDGLPLAELLETIAAQIGRPELLRLGARSAPASEPPLLVPAVERLRQELGWQPRFNLQDGIADTIAWWRKTLAKTGNGGVAVMELVPGWHPVVVHFPLALIVTAAFCLTAAFAMPKNRHAPALATVGTWNLCIGAVAVFVALGTGLGAAMGLHIDAAAHQAVSAHVKSAFVTTRAGAVGYALAQRGRAGAVATVVGVHGASVGGHDSSAGHRLSRGSERVCARYRRRGGGEFAGKVSRARSP